ncbi:hypothetical protein [Streptomyces angustmyceticus]|uniref:hypothetical protein n=1 Tax=Streptomyces angustmyceticus TaxID=285578 RepID=UPI00344C36BF
MLAILKEAVRAARTEGGGADIRVAAATVTFTLLGIPVLMPSESTGTPDAAGHLGARAVTTAVNNVVTTARTSSPNRPTTPTTPEPHHISQATRPAGCRREP